MIFYDESKILFSKIKEDAVIPTKRDEDAGYDIYACFEEDYIIIEPHTTKMIPTGLASCFSSRFAIILKERGSNGSKGIAERCGVIDSGFRAEWFVSLTNTNNIPVIIAKANVDIKLLKQDMSFKEVIMYPYHKAIAQALLVEVPKVKVEEIPYDELLKYSSERGIGKLGSSKK